MAAVDTIFEQLGSMTVLELVELKNKIEEEWGITAAAPVAVAAAGGAAARRRGRRGEDGVRRRPHRGRPAEDPGDQGRPRDHRARPEGSEGPRRLGSQAGQGGRQPGRGRLDQGAARGSRRRRRDQVARRKLSRPYGISMGMKLRITLLTLVAVPGSSPRSRSRKPPPGTATTHGQTAGTTGTRRPARRRPRRPRPRRSATASPTTTSPARTSPGQGVSAKVLVCHKVGNGHYVLVQVSAHSAPAKGKHGATSSRRTARAQARSRATAAPRPPPRRPPATTDDHLAAAERTGTRPRGLARGRRRATIRRTSGDGRWPRLR